MRIFRCECMPLCLAFSCARSLMWITMPEDRGATRSLPCNNLFLCTYPPTAVYHRVFINDCALNATMQSNRARRARMRAHQEALWSCTRAAPQDSLGYRGIILRGIEKKCLRAGNFAGRIDYPSSLPFFHARARLAYSFRVQHTHISSELRASARIYVHVVERNLGRSI